MVGWAESTNAPPASRKRPRSLQEARVQNGVASNTNTVGMWLRDLRGGALPDRAYEKALYDVLLANINRLLHEAASGGSGEPTDGLMVTLLFTLGSSGEISEVRVGQSGLPRSQTSLAMRALELSSPLKPWPERMRKAVGTDLLEPRMDLASTLVNRHSE